METKDQVKQSGAPIKETAYSDDEFCVMLGVMTSMFNGYIVFFRDELGLWKDGKMDGKVQERTVFTKNDNFMGPKDYAESIKAKIYRKKSELRLHRQVSGRYKGGISNTKGDVFRIGELVKAKGVGYCTIIGIEGRTITVGHYFGDKETSVGVRDIKKSYPTIEERVSFAADDLVAAMSPDSEIEKGKWANDFEIALMKSHLIAAVTDMNTKGLGEPVSHSIVKGDIPRGEMPEGVIVPSWKGKRDDKTARAGDYVLRAEMMDRGVWWWNVSYKGEDIDGSCWDREVSTTGKAAMAKCEAAMNKHWKEQRQKQ